MDGPRASERPSPASLPSDGCGQGQGMVEGCLPIWGAILSPQAKQMSPFLVSRVPIGRLSGPQVWAPSGPVCIWEC